MKASLGCVGEVVEGRAQEEVGPPGEQAGEPGHKVQQEPRSVLIGQKLIFAGNPFESQASDWALREQVREPGHQVQQEPRSVLIGPQFAGNFI